jgi:protein tyrosine phosphatase (PTP) superfamily phosphohydrolase (DUF442 family)
MPRARANFLAVVLAIFLPTVFQTGCASRPVETTTKTIVLHPPLSVKDGPQHPLADTVPGVPNFGLISRDVWRGGQPTAEGFQWLSRLGVKTVINLREEDDVAEIPAGVRYVRLPVSAWHADTVDVTALLQAIDTSPKPVFIHCLQGRDRTGLAIAAYRLSQGMSAAQACQELRNFNVNFWWDASITQRVYDLRRAGLSGDRSLSLVVPRMQK